MLVDDRLGRGSNVAPAVRGVVGAHRASAGPALLKGDETRPFRGVEQRDRVGRLALERRGRRWGPRAPIVLRPTGVDRAFAARAMAERVIELDEAPVGEPGNAGIPPHRVVRVALEVGRGRDHLLAPCPALVVRAEHPAAVPPRTRLVVLLERLEGHQDVAVGERLEALRGGLRNGLPLEPPRRAPGRAGVRRAREEVGDRHEPFAVGVVDRAVEALVEADDHGEDAARGELRETRAAQVPAAIGRVVEGPAEVLPRPTLVARAQDVRPPVGALAASPRAMRQQDRPVGQSRDARLAGVPVRLGLGRLVHDAARLNLDAHPSTPGSVSAPPAR